MGTGAVGAGLRGRTGHRWCRAMSRIAARRFPRASQEGSRMTADLRGFVYFARHLDQDVVKIGFSKFPVDRVHKLKFRGSLGRFRLVGVLCGTRKDERWLHREFVAWRLKAPESAEFFCWSKCEASTNALLVLFGAPAAALVCKTVADLDFYRRLLPRLVMPGSPFAQQMEEGR